MGRYTYARGREVVGENDMVSVMGGSGFCFGEGWV